MKQLSKTQRKTSEFLNVAREEALFWSLARERRNREIADDSPLAFAVPQLARETPKESLLARLF